MINIGIVGTNGLVGQAILRSIELLGLNNSNYNFHLMGTKPTQVILNEKIHTVKVFEFSLLTRLEYLILAVDNQVAKDIIEYSNEKKLNIIIIDNSSEYRLEKNIPLIVPEINYHLINTEEFTGLKTKVISNPNCVSTIICMCLRPLLSLSKIKSLVISTYQAASGAGYKGLNELELQTAQCVNNEKITKDFWDIQYVKNVFSHNSTIDPDTGYNQEELKLINETKKILGSDLTDSLESINPTCIRVPTNRSHCVSLCVEFVDTLEKKEIISQLNSFNGIVVMDGLEPNDIPNPIFTSNKPDIYVGRIRSDINNKRIWNFWISCDQLLKGAGYNSVQILKYLLEKQIN